MSRHFPAAAAATALCAALVVGLAVPSTAATSAATKKTTAKTSSKSTSSSGKVVSAKSSVSAVTPTESSRPVPTTSPKPRKAGVPLKGWPALAAGEWPTEGASVAVRPTESSLKVYPVPDDMVASLRFDAGKTVFGSVTLLAVGTSPGWWKVLLPVRPNGTVGWVRAADVERVDVPARIVIELDTNTLTYTKSGKVVVKDRIAAGTGGTPTPTGLFFVKEIVPQANPRGALGPIALGLSGYSEVLYSFAGGSGVIGIHGTNNPSLMGKDVSHGCVRMRNESITAIAAAVQLGTPVEIVKTASHLPTQRWSWSPDTAAATATDTATAAATTATATAQGTVPVTTTAGAVAVAAPVASVVTGTTQP